MEVVNKVFPNREQIEGFMAPGQDGPIYMLNLLTFKEKAEYPDGRDTDLTGAEADSHVGDEVVFGLPTAVRHHDAPVLGNTVQARGDGF